MLILLIYLILISPVRLTVLLDGPLTLDIRIWGLGGSWRPTFPSATTTEAHQPFIRILGTVLRTDKARRIFRQHVQLQALQAMIHLGFADAARTALVTGLLRQLCIILPPIADIRIQPDFLHTTRVQLRCILFFRLGTILIIAVMVLLAWLGERREHPAPKEA